MKVVGVVFENDDKIYYLDASKFDLKKNITVVAKTEKGLFFAKVVSVNENDKEIIGQVVRISSKKDYLEFKNNQKLAREALKKCRNLAEKYHLNMNIIDATFNLNKDQLLFHFYSDERIDFRNLAKELASLYKTRIELRQIGVRDKAKKVGGYGSCGQKLCCSRFLNDFDSISITMAKNQNLSLNPNKINGICGRLLCCLKYENETYQKCKKKLPKIGEIVEINNEKGQVISVNLIKETYKVDLQKQGIVEVQYKDGSSK